MAISFSRPDPSSPAAVSDATFNTGRRGFDQQEVRDFLRMVSAELARLQERERFLERELRAAQSPGTSSTPIIDDDTATRLLGEEAARILQTARDAGTQIKARAEDGAARLLREATDEANRQREQAELEGSRRRSDAAADAEAELAMATQQGREMVEEARAYRERVLAELARRRELARQQIDQLIHGRDRLLQSFERARLVAVDVMAEMAPLTEPDEYVDLSPTTGPVPLTIPAGSLGDASAVSTTPLPGERVDDSRDDATTFEAVGQPYDAAGDDMLDTAMLDVAGEDPEVAQVADGEAAGAAATAEQDHYPALTAVPDLGPLGAPAPTVDDDGEAPAATDGAEVEEIDDDEVTAGDVEELLARLRTPVVALDPEDSDPVTTEQTAPVEGESGADSDADAVSDTVFQRRDEALVPLIVASARKLKRVLADEQNEVLDALRRSEPVRDLEALVASEAEQSGRYADAITQELSAVAEAAATSMAGGAELDLGPDGPLEPTRLALAERLVVPLRERLSRCIDDGDGDNDAIVKRARAVYREWKTQRIDEQLDDLLRSAFARAAYDAVPPGTSVTWAVDPAGPASPDCEDNSLTGPVIVGDGFPTGHSCPPAHPGCRCLLVIVDG